MSANSNREIYSSRVLNSSLEKVYEAFANPMHLKNWWGPEGFTNTIHEFNLQAGGKWLLTMHGSDKANYENSSVFVSVEPQKLVTWTRKTQPHFDMEVGFQKIDEGKAEISFRMIFTTVESCEQLRKYVEPKNEENFDRLEKVLSTMQTFC